MEKEMNFFDLCVAGFRALGRGCKACGRVIARMLRLTYRYWWVVLTITALALAAALYYTREKNIKYRVNAVAMVNAASLQQFEQAFAPLQADVKVLPDEEPIKHFIKSMKATRFETYHVIDCMDDGNADFIDFKRAIKSTDTTNIIMQDRICIQFRVKERNLDSLPEMEQAVVSFLNANEALQQSFEVYRRNLAEEVAFNHSQAQKLDSLTTQYYFHRHQRHENLDNLQQGTVMLSTWGGDWGVNLFLDEIYEQRERMQRIDYRYHLATAPVVLENHFMLDPAPVNGRRKMGVLFLLFGWVAGCVLAELIDRRKAIFAWLKR